MNDFEVLKNLLVKDRSIRRFYENEAIDEATLEKLVELTRYCGSGRNLQPLKYRIVVDEDEKRGIYLYLAWAGYYKDWDGPEEGERPAAYLVQCMDSRLAKDCLCDDGLQLQAITLGAAAMGVGGCIIKSFNADKISEILKLGKDFTPRYVLALGRPKEVVEIEEMSGDIDADYKYYRTPDSVHHVPKRPLSELVI